MVEPRTRRSLLRGGGALLATALAGCLGRRPDRLRADVGSGRTETAGASPSREHVHGIDAVCHNCGARPRTIALTVAATDDPTTTRRTVWVDAGETVVLPDLVEEPVDGSVPHEIGASTARDDDAETVVANAVHDVHEIHVVVDEDGVRVDAVEH